MSLATFSGSISTMAGSTVHCWARFITSLVKVAENSRVWRSPLYGVWRMIWRTCGMKPMSSMRSASSSTITSTMSRCTSPRWLKSSRRPGVATRMSQKRDSRVRSCLSKSMPPTKLITFSPVYLARPTASLAICTTSSRVGAMISARGSPM
ncbi:hypothetical protein D9M71_726170 [compost metagenome]